MKSGYFSGDRPDLGAVQYGMQAPKTGIEPIVGTMRGRPLALPPVNYSVIRNMVE